MSDNIIIPDPARLAQIKKAMADVGPEKIHILSDFDRTLTTAFIDGRPMPSLMSILRDGNYLTPDYAEKAKAFYNKYHPIEISPNIPLAEKKQAMLEWWETHFKILIELGLNKKDIERVIENGQVKFRPGVLEFLDFLQQHKIPLVIMSASGLGDYSIALYFENANRLTDNIHIICNSYVWDKDGRAVAIKQPIIHSLNKDETVVRDFPVFEKIKDRKNVILLGDNPEDIGMIEGFDYDNLIRVGFLNEEVEKNLEPFKKSYDAVILNDGPFDFVNEMMNEIVK